MNWKKLSARRVTAPFTQNMPFEQPPVCRYQEPLAVTHISKYLLLKTDSTSDSSRQIQKCRLLCWSKCYFLWALDEQVIKNDSSLLLSDCKSFFLIMLSQGSERWTPEHFFCDYRCELARLNSGNRAILAVMQKQQVPAERPGEETYLASAVFVQWPYFCLYSKVLPCSVSPKRITGLYSIFCTISGLVCQASLGFSFQ